MRSNLYDHVLGLTVQSMISSVFTPLSDLEISITYFFKLIWLWIRQFIVASEITKNVMKYMPESSFQLQLNAQLKLKAFLINECYYSTCFMVEADPERHIYYLRVFCLTKDFNIEAVEAMMIFSEKLEHVTT